MRSEMVSDCIRVRAFREADCESISEVAPFETWCHPGYALDEAKDYVTWWIKAWERKRAFNYVIEDAASLEFLGSCGVHEVSDEHRHAMLGYWVRTSQTRRGIATRAARLVASAAFADLDLLRVAIGVPVANTPSHRVVAKLGAVREGVLRQELVLPSGPADVVLYSILPGELRTG